MLRYLTAGESHGRCLMAILEGMPAGLKVDEEIINRDLRRRQTAFGRGPRMAMEYDTVQVLSGLRKGATIGSPIALMIENKDASIDSLPVITSPRPGHADLAGVIKYDSNDIRDILERASARETAIRVALGGVCKILLDEFDIEILSHVVELGGIKADIKGLSYKEIKSKVLKSPLNCANKQAEKAMVKKIESASKNGNTLGGICEIIAVGIPIGLGSYVHSDRRLDARIAGTLMSIQAIKGVEIGLGFKAAALLGSKVHDEIVFDKRKGFSRRTNAAGGLEGGVTNGQPLVVRIAMKPIATLGKPLASVDIKTKRKLKAQVERHDICAVAAAGIVGEAVLAFELANAMREKFGGDSLSEMKRNYAGYIKQVRSF